MLFHLNFTKIKILSIICTLLQHNMKYDMGFVKNSKNVLNKSNFKMVEVIPSYTFFYSPIKVKKKK